MLGDERVLEADVEVGVRVGGEGHAVFPDKVARVAVFVLEGVFDLERRSMLATFVMMLWYARVRGLAEQGRFFVVGGRDVEKGALGTDMHVHHLAITFHAINDRCDKYESVLARKVADAALILVVVAGMGREVEFEGRGKGREGGQQDNET